MAVALCGIAAILSPTRSDVLYRHASEMIRLLHHRGPDDEQVVTFDRGREVHAHEPASIALAHSRLSILDLSSAGRQPMADPSGRFHLIFNGEIYNYLELREDLEQQGELFQSSGDTEVLLRLLAREGKMALAKLDGMFAFLLLDVIGQKVLAVRDRFGIKPLYYWIAPDGNLVMSSEIKAFTVYPGWRAELNRQRAYDYLARGLIDHTAETMFKDVFQIPAGHLVEIDLQDSFARISPQRWYRLCAASIEMNPDECVEHCGELLGNSVKQHLRADVTVGSCLSGGLDSSSIVCLAAEALREQGIKGGQFTFTSRHPDELMDEWEYAQVVARRTGANPVEVHPEPGEFFNLISDLVWIQDEPFGSASIFAQYKVFESAAAHHVKVMLDGQGADEQLAGYHAFFKVYLLELIRQGKLRTAVNVMRGLKQTHGLGLIRLLTQALGTALPEGITRYFNWRGCISQVIDIKRLGPEPVDPFHAMNGQRRGVQAFSMDQLSAGSLPMLLHWEDRNSMAHSVEARVPFLASSFVEFVLGLPAHEKLDGHWTKKILREAMRSLVPEQVLQRTDKIAFATPDRQWFLQSHRDEAERVLMDALDAGGSLVHTRGCEVLGSILDSRRPYDDILWRVMCFGVWIRRFDIGV